MVQHRKDRLAALIARHRGVDARVTAQKAVVEDKQRLVDIEKDKLGEINTERLQVRTAIHKLHPFGFDMDEFDRTYQDMVKKTPRSDIEQRLAGNEEMREVMGMPTYHQQQLDMTQPAPDHVQVLEAWRKLGERDAMLGPCDPQSAGCPPEAFQAYIGGWNDKQAAIGRGLKEIERDAEPALPLLPEGEGAPRPDWSMWDASHHHWTDDQKAAFKVWYDALDTALQPDVTNKAVLARIDFLDHEQDRAEPSEDGEKIDTDEAADPDANALAGKNVDTGEDFEASEDELEAQTQRRVLKEQKASDGGLLN